MRSHMFLLSNLIFLKLNDKNLIYNDFSNQWFLKINILARKLNLRLFFKENDVDGIVIALTHIEI